MEIVEHGLSVLSSSMHLEMLHPFDEREYSRLRKLYRDLAALEEAILTITTTWVAKSSETMKKIHSSELILTRYR